MVMSFSRKGESELRGELNPLKKNDIFIVRLNFMIRLELNYDQGIGNGVKNSC